MTVGEDNDTPTVPPPNRVGVYALRGMSLTAAYGLWVLSRWLYTTQVLQASWGIYMFLAASLGCLFFIYLGTFASDKVVSTSWRRLGKGILYLFLLT